MNPGPFDPPPRADGLPQHPPPLGAPPAAPAPPDAAGPPASTPPASELSALDPRAIAYWRVHSLIGSCFLLAGLAVVGVFTGLAVPESLFVILGAWSAVLLFRVWWFFWHPIRSYRAWGYRVDDKVLETRRGIWIRVVTLLPLSRLQHVDLHRGPLERYFGIASLVLQTAGTHNATMVIPGLDAGLAVRLRDQLITAGGDDAV